MKKAILIVMMILISFSNGEAKESKEYTFMMTVINTLDVLQSVLEEETREGDGLTEMMSKAMIRNHRLTAAKTCIRPYQKSKDRLISDIVKGFDLGIDLLMAGWKRQPKFDHL